MSKTGRIKQLGVHLFPSHLQWPPEGTETVADLSQATEAVTGWGNHGISHQRGTRTSRRTGFPFSPLLAKKATFLIIN